MTFENSITIIWMFPVFFQIVLPLILLLFFCVGKILVRLLGLSPAEKKTAPVQAIGGKHQVPTTGAIA